MPDESLGIDFEGEVAVIVTDVPMGASRDAAAASIVLIVLVNDVSLRNLIPASWPRGSASSSRNLLRRFRRSRFLPASSAPHGTANACIFPCLSASTASRSGGRMPAPNEFRFPGPYCACGEDKAFGGGHHCRVGKPIKSWMAVLAARSPRAVSATPALPRRGWSRPFATARQIPHFCAMAIRCDRNEGSDGHSVFGAIEQTVEPYARPPA